MHPILNTYPVAVVLKSASVVFRLPLVDLTGPARSRSLVRARQVAWYAAHEHLGVSYPQIAKAFNRDHTTVLYGVRRIAGLLNEDEPGLEERVAAIVGYARRA